MAALQLTATQTAVLNQLLQLADGSLEAVLADAIGQGVVDNNDNILCPAISAWGTGLTPAQQTQALQGLCQGFAALMVALGLPAPAPTGFTGTIPLAALTTIQGSLTFVNGVCTAAISPA